MIKRVLLLGTLFASCISTLTTCGVAQVNRSDFVSDASLIIATYRPEKVDHSAESIARVTDTFLESLSANQRKKIKLPLDDQERREWTNLPPQPNAGGLPIIDLNEEQVKKACNMLACMFSESGYKKMCGIMLADDQLVSKDQPRPGFGTLYYSFVVFGEPSATEPWAFQLDGHHIAANLSFHKDAISMSPSFIGTQPELFNIASTDYRPLTGEIDIAYELALSLNDSQRKQAVLGQTRGQIVTGPGADGVVPKPKGLACKELNESQKEQLVNLIDQWVQNLPAPQAELEMKRLTAEIDRMYFAWNGAVERRSDASYIIQGPSLIVEYACQGAPDNPLYHLHTMYRNPQNEYGKQISVSAEK